MRPKIALVLPNFRWVDNDKDALWHYLPHNLCMLASCVRDISDVSIVDAYKNNMSRDELEKTLAGLKPDIVGITVLIDKYGPSGHTVAEMAKALGCTTVIGGVYASMNAEQVAQDKNIDYVIKGEGEHLFRRLVLNNGLPDKITQADRIQDLDALPLPAYDLIDFQAYATNADRKGLDSPPKMPYGRVLTSRGCPFGCVFCQVEKISGNKFRPRSAESVLGEIQWLKDTYGIKSLMFDDDNMLADRSRAGKIFEGMISRGLAMPWVMIATAVFKLDEDLIRLMRASGCTYVNVAIESGTERVLRKIINKPIALEQAKAAVRSLQDNGIYVAANFIIGFPTETWDEIRQTIAFAQDLDADYTKFFTAIPLRNTRLWDLCEKENAFKKDFNGAGQWSNGQIETEHFKADDLMVLRAYEWDRINFTDKTKRRRICEMMGVSEEELLRIRRETITKSLPRIHS